MTLSDSEKPTIYVLFSQALERPAKERPAWLASQCDPESSTYHEVLSLLEVLQDNPSYLEEPLFGQTQHMWESLLDPNLQFPEMNDYHLKELIYQGQNASVYLAEQYPPDGRICAVKVFFPSLYSRDLAKRFILEQQVSLHMDHVNIAKVFEFGHTREKHLFFSMEYVPGKPITRYCDQQSLSLKHRLELFLRVCEGVSYAHRKGIIHRDLKPSNILVDSHLGIPKIIDFGLAKASRPFPGIKHSPNSVGFLMGTPPYLSPEQASGNSEDVGVRSDVFALGILLYIIVCGEDPYNLEWVDTPIATLGSLIRDHTFDPPSVALSKSKTQTDICKLRNTNFKSLYKRLKEDVDWVVLKAVEKDPDRRYSGMDALIADIQNLILHQEVTARPPNRGYRIKKYLLRHKLRLFFTFVFTSSLLIITVVSLFSFYKVSAAKEETQVFNRMLEQLFTAGDPRLTKQGVSLEDYFLVLEERIQEVQIDQPIQAAHFFNLLGKTEIGLGHYNRAAQVLEKGHHLLMENHETDTRVYAENAYFYGMSWLYQDQETQALSMFQEAEAAARNLDDPAFHFRLRRAFLDLKRNLPNQDPDALLEEYSNLLNEQHQVLGQFHEDSLLTATNLANYLQKSGRFADAELYYRRLYKQKEQFYGTDHPYTANAANLLANNLYFQGKALESLPLAKLAAACFQKVLGENHPYTLSGFINLANHYDQLGFFAEAAEYYRKVIALPISSKPANFQYTLPAMNNLADLLMRQGCLSEALEIKEQELSLYQQHYPQTHVPFLESRLTYAELLLRNRQFYLAEDELQDLYEKFIETSAPGFLTDLTMGFLAISQAQLTGAPMPTPLYLQAKKNLRGTGYAPYLTDLAGISAGVPNP